MERTQQILGERLPSDTREIFFRRCDLLIGDLAYIAENRREQLAKPSEAGWSVQRLKVLLVLNAFYQTILAPLQSSARPDNQSPISRIDVIYGQTSFGEAWRMEINSAHSAFQSLMIKLQISERLLSAQRASDVLFQAGRFAADHE
ncbi:MAG TPA: hypothetical protein VGM64_04845 [Lacunisphaera sp.]|jgi:hypothetical protein